MNFKKWLNLTEVGTMASGPTGGVGDIAPFKAPMGWGVIRRNWPAIDPFFTQKSKKKRSRGVEKS